MSSIKDQVIAIIAEQAVLEPEDVTMDSTLESLGIDSLGLVESIFAIEEAFDISVPFNANNPTGNLNDTVGINNYLIYNWSDCIGLGTRLEWWKADGGSLWEMTYGANIKPHSGCL